MGHSFTGEGAAGKAHSGRGTAWRLPTDKTCARAARQLVRDALTELGVSDDLIHSAITLVSELATNVYQHAPSATAASPYGRGVGLPELWLDRQERPEPQLVIEVFDVHRRWRPPTGPRALLEESGRGLEVVAALAAEWGIRPARSRLGAWPIPGKTVWAVLALPMAEQPPGSATVRPSAADRPSPPEETS